MRYSHLIVYYIIGFRFRSDIYPIRSEHIRTDPKKEGKNSDRILSDRCWSDPSYPMDSSEPCPALLKTQFGQERGRRLDQILKNTKNVYVDL